MESTCINDKIKQKKKFVEENQYPQLLNDYDISDVI